MELGFHYARGQFRDAVDALTIGVGEIRTRLSSAYLCFATLQAHDLPEEVREDYKGIIRTITKLPAEGEGEGKVKATLRSMGDEEAVDVAKRIVHLYDRLGKFRP